MKPLLLDLFCGQGGAGRGYADAGFDVVGVDISLQPRYPYEFHRADALEFVAKFSDDFDAIHASPPCQAKTTMSNRWRGAGGKADNWPDLIRPTREALTTTGRPWVLENVPGARVDMPDAVTLHGGMFGLGVDRPRLFAASFPIVSAYAPKVRNPLGVYGKSPDGRRLFTRKDGTNQYAAASVPQAGEAMGIDWMDWDGLRESIPPAYTRHIGEQLLAHIGTTNQEAA